MDRYVASQMINKLVLVGTKIEVGVLREVKKEKGIVGFPCKCGEHECRLEFDLREITPHALEEVRDRRRSLNRINIPL